MPSVSAPAPSLDSIQRIYEGYTPTLSVIVDNDAVFVDVLDITGRGILVSIGAEGDDDQTKIAKITIDSSVVYNDIISAQDSAGTDIVLFQGFDTNCKVEMKLGGATVARFRGFALVE